MPDQSGFFREMPSRAVRSAITLAARQAPHAPWRRDTGADPCDPNSLRNSCVSCCYCPRGKKFPRPSGRGEGHAGRKKSRPAVTVRRPVSLQADGLAEVRGRAFRCRGERSSKPEASRLDVGVLHIAGGRCRRIDGSPDPAGTETGEQLWKEWAGRGIGRSGGVTKRRLIGLQVPVGRKLDLVLPGLGNLPGLQPIPD